MKRICILLIMIALTALGTNAQTVTGSGTTNTIPKFTSSSTIGDSQIRQSNDNIGINADFIVGRLSVFESRENGINFPQPYAVYGNISSDINFAAGVRGDASATTGNAAGVIGVSYSPDGKGVNGFMGSSSGQGVGVVGTTLGTDGIVVIGNPRTPRVEPTEAAEFAALPPRRVDSPGVLQGFLVPRQEARSFSERPIG